MEKKTKEENHMKEKLKKAVESLKEASRRVNKYIGRQRHHDNRRKHFLKILEKAQKDSNSEKLTQKQRNLAHKRYEWALKKFNYHRKRRDKYTHSRKEWEKIEKNRRAKVKKIKKKIEKEKPKTGTGAWGGSQSILDVEVAPIANLYGSPIVSRKRSRYHSLSISNPDSDHNEANTTAYAYDLGTYNGSGMAHAIADALGIDGYSTGNYNNYYIKRSGKTFRVQILWAVSGHYNHVHIGVRLS